MQHIMVEGAELKQVGWLIWNNVNPASRHFSVEELRDVDRRNGYQSKPVYEIVG